MSVEDIKMGMIKGYFKHVRKPEGIWGKLMMEAMNRAHASVSDWGMGHLWGISPDRIAELGCGGGRNTVQLLKKFPKAKVTALDYSQTAVEKTKHIGRQAIQAGRLQVIWGNVSHLPFQAEVFDLITAFETVYFWPGPVESFREVWRVLKPGGMFLIVNEADGTGKEDRKWMSMIDGLQIYHKDQLKDFLQKAGFKEIMVDCDQRRHWLCMMAKKETAQ